MTDDSKATITWAYSSALVEILTTLVEIRNRESFGVASSLTTVGYL